MWGRSCVALTSIRFLGYAVLAYSLFYLAMTRGKWYRENFFANDELALELNEDIQLRNSHAQVALFLLLFPVIAAALGGIYEAVWKNREGAQTIRDSSNKSVDVSSTQTASVLAAHTEGAQNNSVSSGNYEDASSTSSPGILAVLHSIIHYPFRFLGSSYFPWMSVGEAIVLFLWIASMVSHVWQGVHRNMENFYDETGPCVDDPTVRCSLEEPGTERAATPGEERLFMVAIYMGFVATCHFAVILIPVSRDSKLWSAVGIPFERAVLYHVIAGHLAFATMFCHAFLFVILWVWQHGWAHAWETSTTQINDEYGNIDVPMGWAAAACATPMWLTSVNYVRRRWYSLFKASHWLFIGVFLFACFHWASNTIYFGGGLALYTLHVMSRLSAWKRWRYWNRWWSPATKASPTSLVNVRTISNYTRLVLRNPKSYEPARGGSFVYISVPAALGTDEAHAMTVALRGAPPSFSPGDKRIASRHQEEFFTLYIKDLGPWTGALRSVANGAEVSDDPKSLLVDVDGFYTHVTSFNTMMVGGAGRIVVVAGGSGATSLMGFIQDWCVAASAGSAVPAVHFVWCCRSMQEMELVGESLPSMLASAGSKKDSHFTMSLYCTSSKEASGPLSVTWPLDNSYYTKTSREQVMGKTPIASSINHSIRVLIAGGAIYGANLLGNYEVHRRQLFGFHEGGTLLALMIVCVVGALIVYDWLTSLVQMLVRKDAGGTQDFTAKPAEESKADMESGSTKNTATYEVSRGRVPANALLTQEALLAKKKGLHVVKVLTSGPQALVDSILAESRAVDWKLFDTEEFSFAF